MQDLQFSQTGESPRGGYCRYTGVCDSDPPWIRHTCSPRYSSPYFIPIEFEPRGSRGYACSVEVVKRSRSSFNCQISAPHHECLS